MTTPTEPTADSVVRCAASDSFGHWISQCGGSLAVTTYQARKAALIGWDPGAAQVALPLRHFQKPMGSPRTTNTRRDARAASPWRRGTKCWC